MTLNMLTLGIYILMMSNVIGSPSIVIAMPVRGREVSELEPVMGFFNNLLSMPFQVEGSLRFGEFMHYVKQELISVMDHQQIPFERLVQEPEYVERARGVGLYQALFSFQDAREREREVGGLADRQMHLLQRGATDDLGLWLMDKSSVLEGSVVYNADIYKEETGAAFAERYVELLRRVVDQADSTLEAILEPASSASAAYLQRLVASVSTPAPATRPARPPAVLPPEQSRLAQIWASALSIHVEDIHANVNFFDLGGDSLMTRRVVLQAEQMTGFRVDPRRYVFETLAQLSSAVANENDASTPARETTKRGLLGRVFSGWKK